MGGFIEDQERDGRVDRRPGEGWEGGSMTRIGMLETSMMKKVFFFLCCVGLIKIYLVQNNYVGVLITTISDPRALTNSWRIFISTCSSRLNDISTERNETEYANLERIQSHSVVETSKWQKVTLEDVVESFRAKTLESCDNTCHDWSHNESLCYYDNESMWLEVIRASSFPVNPLLTNGQYIYEFEKDYLSYPPLEDMKQLPDVKLSKVTMFGVDNDTVRCLVGDTVTGRVDLVNGYGQPRAVGGDEVRVWLVDSGAKQYRSSGHVTDLNNGSYLITAWCLWPGMTQINVAVAYPREYIRVVIHQAHLSASRFVQAKFLHNNTEEVTLCWSLPNIVGRPCVCNFTHIIGQSFYCGRPLSKRLGCENWNATFSTPLVQPHNVTDEERLLIKRTPTAYIMTYSIPNNIQLAVREKGKPTHLRPCSLTNLKVTWELRSTPGGFWGPNLTWSSLQCARPEVTVDWARSCLRDTTVWVFGDSNGVRLFNAVKKYTNCSKMTHGIWPLSGNCTLEKHNITIVFTPHELPLYQKFEWTPRLGYRSVAEYIKMTPSAGKHIFIIHYYLHVTPSHLAVLHARLLSLSDAVRQLVARNPDAFFVIRGPHAISLDYNGNHAIGGDNLGPFYVRLLRETFRDLQDKIIYLDGWGMTVSMENARNHPDDRVPEEMIRTVLAFRCNETGYVARK
ncbi:hypothetical protein Btru_060960 [Bulinus truncatus]|nr:hypothetical protein Btru_060960 [Bulinus truncatus]